MLKKNLFLVFAISICLTVSAQLEMSGGGIGGKCKATAISGSTLCIGEGATLSVIDVSTPGSPQVMGRLRVPGVIGAVSIDGSKAFASCGTRGVHIIDISTPASPVLLGTISSASQSYAAVASGSAVFVADGSAGLRIFNISTPASPQLLGSLPTEGPARDVMVQSTTAYVLDYHLGLLVVDVSSTSAPTQVGSVETLPFGCDICMAGANVALVDQVSIFALIDVSVPASPAVLSTIDLAAPPRAVSAEGSFAFAALGAAGVQPVNISTPAVPVAGTPVALSGVVSDLTVSSSVAYAAAGFGGLSVLNVSTPATPVEIAAVQYGTRASQVVTDSGIAYVAAGETGVKIYNVTDPADPILLGSCSTGGNARDLFLSGNTLYVADDIYGLTAVDVSNPSLPTLVTTSLNVSLQAVRTLTGNAGGILAASDGDRIQLFNGLSPAGICDVSGHVFDLAFQNNLLLVAAGGAGLVVLDVTSIGSPTVIGTCDTQGDAVAVTVSGSDVYLVDDESGSHLVDLSSPALPVLGQPVAAGGGLRDIAVDGDTAFTAGNALTQSTDVTPAVPVTRDTLTDLVRAMQVAASGSSVFVAEEAAGVAVLNQSPAAAAAPVEPDNDGDQMADSWEQQIVDADPNDGIDTIDDVLADGDFDGDGLLNSHEYIAGTDPTDPASIFAITSVQKEVDGFIVEWYGEAGKTYTIHKSTNLADGFTPIATDISGVSPISQYIDESTDGEKAFYMISIQE